MIISLIVGRSAPTNRQLHAIERLVRQYNPESDKFQHGMDEVDYPLHNILRSNHFNITGFPLADYKNDINFAGITVAESLQLRQRNQKLVETAEEIIAFPQMMNEYEDSPCWKTIRHAVGINKEITIISPAGWIYGVEF